MKTDQPAQLNKDNTERYVIVDTCILIYAGSKEKSQSEAVLNCLEEIVATGYKLAISEYTTYEYLRGLWGKKAETAGAALRRYEAKVVSSQVLLLASLLDGLYHDEGINNLSDGDKIIAATAILENGFIFTRNHKDFPSPFFLPEKFMILPIHYHHYTQHMDLALYKPHIALIERRVDEKGTTK